MVPVARGRLVKQEAECNRVTEGMEPPYAVAAAASTVGLARSSRL